MTRKLALVPEDEVDARESLIARPAVLSRTYDDAGLVEESVVGVVEVVEGASRYAAVLSPSGTVHAYRLAGDDHVNVNREKGEITFSAYGRVYTVRAFEDRDGRWASMLRVPVPAEVIEEILMAVASFNPEHPLEGESLFAAVDEATDEVRELVYSSEGGMYFRADGGWARVPLEDETIDGALVVEVDPALIETFDAAERAGQTLTRKDVEPEAAE